MAIDYIIGYSCEPKTQLTPGGILSRLKGEERAQAIIHLYRKNDDQRLPAEMGFEFTRRTPQGDEETRVVIVQDLLDAAAELHPLEHHCKSCPANRAGRRFGCIGFIQYPISTEAEAWMLDQLPVPDEVLSWALLKQGIEEFRYDGKSIEPLRSATGIYFESVEATSRLLGAFRVDSNQVFEMIFGVGHITPNHAALLLMFLNAITRDLEADQIQALAPASKDTPQQIPFLMAENNDDNLTIAELKAFFHALYTAWTLDVQMFLDA